MSTIQQYLRSILQSRSVESEVDDELRHHLDMKASQFETQGMPAHDALMQAQLQFGDYDRVKRECIEIASKNTVGVRIAKLLFTISFVLGVLIRIVSPELHVTRIGDVLIMIGVFGAVLLAGKRFHLNATRISEPLKLGLTNDSIPRAFDNEGRTPFERVKLDD